MPNIANEGTAIVIIKILFMIQPFKQTEGNLFRVLRNGDTIPLCIENHTQATCRQSADSAGLRVFTLVMQMKQRIGSLAKIARQTDVSSNAQRM